MQAEHLGALVFIPVTVHLVFLVFTYSESVAPFSLFRRNNTAKLFKFNLIITSTISQYLWLTSG